VTLSALVADDHPPTRADLSSALREGGFEVLAEVATANAALEAAHAHRPHVALLDVRMPGNGILAARAIACVCPLTTIVMLTVSNDEADMLEALKAGASGYLLKDLSPQRLVAALRSLLEGEIVLPRSLVAGVIEEFQAAEARARWPRRGPSIAKLTAKEWEVLEMMGEGLATAGIAKRLYVSEVTVRSHVHAILRKLQVPNRDAAVKWLQGGN
jgi:DNA-binding NarL/FixJ family response regulator